LKRTTIAAVLAALGLLAAVPSAQAAAATALATSCTPQKASARPFTPWNDLAYYTLVSGGDAEGALSGWTLDGARVVEGNEPFKVGRSTDHRSIALTGGASVTTAPICIDSTYPWFRFFARNTSGHAAQLKVDIFYTDTLGRVRNAGTGDYSTADGAWVPTGSLGIGIAWQAIPAGSSLPVTFRFTAVGTASWLVDDVYVDPFARR
jgi:hypothetical protein